MSQIRGVVSRNTSSIEPSAVQVSEITSNGLLAHPKRASDTLTTSYRSSGNARMLHRIVTVRPWRICRRRHELMYCTWPENVTAG
jgi:hypothetical protein